MSLFSCAAAWRRTRAWCWAARGYKIPRASSPRSWARKGYGYISIYLSPYMYYTHTRTGGTDICIHTYAYILTYLHVLIHIYTNAHTPIHSHAHTRTYTHAHAHTRTHTQTHTHAHAHAHTLT